jgi:hypothetical protein
MYSHIHLGRLKHAVEFTAGDASSWLVIMLVATQISLKESSNNPIKAYSRHNKQGVYNQYCFDNKIV